MALQKSFFEEIDATSVVSQRFSYIQKGRIFVHFRYISRFLNCRFYLLL